MDTGAVLAAYDQQVRGAGGGLRVPVGRLERVSLPHGALVLRHLVGEDQASVIWADLAGLDGTGVADVVAAEAAAARARGLRLEWKHYGHDRPADLPGRLVAAGFAAQPAEALLVAETAQVCGLSGPGLPAGVVLEEVMDVEALAAVAAVAAQAFDEDPAGAEHRQQYAELGEQLRAAPQSLAIVLVRAGGEPVGEGRVEFPPSGEFAGLWGGGIVPAWRGRGLYRATVGYRAALAGRRGYRYLTVDALPTSAPILARLGFVELTTTTPFLLVA